MEKEKRDLLDKLIHDLGLTLAISARGQTAIIETETRSKLFGIPNAIEVMKNFGFELVGPVQICSVYRGPHTTAHINYLITFKKS